MAAPDIFAEREESQQRHDEASELRSAIGQLEKKEQEIIILRFYKKKTHAEIADIIGKERSGITRQLQAAMKNLKKLLG